MRGTAAIAAVDAIVSFVVLTLVGVSFAGPLAVLVLAAGFIPYIGGLFVAAILGLAGLAIGGVPTALLLLALAIILKVIEKRLLGRFLSDRTLGLHPAVILLALLVGYTMGGLAGMFVAVPTVAFVMAISGAVLDVLGTTGRVRVSVRGDIPAWLDRLAQWSWRLLVAVGLIALAVAILSQFPVVVGPIVVAITLAATFLPAVKTLEGRGWSRGRASFVVSVAVWATVTIVTWLSVSALGASVQESIQAAGDRGEHRGWSPARGCVRRRRTADGPGGLGVARRRRVRRDRSRLGAWCSSWSRRCSPISCCATATGDGRGSPRISMAGAGRRSRSRAIGR